MKHREVILFLSHFTSPGVAAEFERLRRAGRPDYDVLLYFDDSENELDEALFAEPPEVCRFDKESLFGLGYPLKGRNRRYHPGNQDLTVLSFFARYPEYEFYWLIEHDVRFSGDWRVFFDTFAASGSDLLGTSLRPRSADPGWEFWHTVEVPQGVAVEPRHETIGFFPVLRLSNRALEALHDGYMRGFDGHFEAVLPTLLRLRGMEIEDIGGHGPFVAPENRGRFYANTPTHPLLSPGTFVFRPARREIGAEPDMLWHPVKGGGDPAWRYRRWPDRIARLGGWCRRLVSR